MTTLHPTAQYGQTLRVCVVREIFSACACAAATRRSKPNAVTITAPALKNPRRDSFAGIVVPESSRLVPRKEESDAVYVGVVPFQLWRGVVALRDQVWASCSSCHNLRGHTDEGRWNQFSAAQRQEFGIGEGNR
jgi:hypothetical protein